jgi:hypothetical protein
MNTVLFVNEECISCGVIFGVSPLYQIKRREDTKSFYCPNGHPQLYAKSEADNLRARLALKDQELSVKQAEIERLKKQLKPPSEKRKRGRPRKPGAVVEPPEEG